MWKTKSSMNFPRKQLNPTKWRLFSAFPKPLSTDAEIDQAELNLAQQLTAHYRASGHLKSQLDPLQMAPKPSEPATLNPEGKLRIEQGRIKVGKSSFVDINAYYAELARIYSGNIGYEIAHLTNSEEREWLYDNIEAISEVQASSALKRRMAKLLLRTEAFDHFMAKRFGQVKRYGLEGGESMMIVLDTLIQLTDAPHMVIGMPHRGRLNLIVDLLNYPPEALFHKLGGNSELGGDHDGSADVISHLSITEQIAFGGHPHGYVTLLPNPSHLEAINPVEVGVTYALQHFKDQGNSLSIQIHGDAAFSGQGVVQETLQMSNLKGFSVGGTIHLIVNNQLGYTATPNIYRTAQYSSGPAKIIDAPIVHVNGDCPEDVARATSLALKYRKKFGKDVVIDLICYRRHGHNELDEPAFTQPKMYENIRSRPSLPTIYSSRLVADGVMKTEDVEAVRKEEFDRLDAALAISKEYKPRPLSLQTGIDFQKSTLLQGSSVSMDDLKEVGRASVTVPDNITIHPRLKKYHVDSRLNLLNAEKADWATAEALAFGMLLKSGFNIRLVGQDVQRGTFSQRHMTFHDQQTGDTYTPFSNLSPSAGKFEVVNSHLSEFAVLGFEYGVSIADCQNTLPIWEAQFGDFFNGAQIIFDTFISSGESKWALQSGLVVLLPHGYDGTGPEHSSCRLERFLQMCNAPLNPTAAFNPNWHVANPTTPANYFHLLRRQMIRSYRKPLIVASPKTLLRLPNAISNLSEMSSPENHFQPLIDDPNYTDDGSHQSKKNVTTLVFCSGKFYYELEKERATRKVSNMAIVRIEELCPFPTKALQDCLASYKTAKRIIWCQEEHANMGAYTYVAPRLQALLRTKRHLHYVGRKESGVPAAGYSKLHKAELAAIFDELFSK